MIRLAQFLVLQAFHHLDVTLAHSEQGRIPARGSLSFCFCEYPGSRLPKLGVILTMNNVGPTQLVRMV